MLEIQSNHSEIGIVVPFYNLRINQYGKLYAGTTPYIEKEQQDDSNRACGPCIMAIRSMYKKLTIITAQANHITSPQLVRRGCMGRGGQCASSSTTRCCGTI